MKCGNDCLTCKKDAPLYSFYVNFGLTIYKGLLGIVSGSAALIADAFHSLADVVCSIVTMISMKISARPENEDYQYGYGKIQYFSTAVVGTVLIMGALFLFFESLILILKGNAQAPHAVAAWGAIISIAVNEFMYRYQMCVAMENNSPAIRADALDNRSDALSSIGVLFGIVGAVIGFPFLDPLAAMFVAFLVLKIGLELVQDALKGLMDGSIEVQDLKKIYKITSDVKGVQRIAYLRGRFMGETSWIDIEIEVNSKLPVEKSDQIVVAVEKAVMEKVSHVGEVLVFCKPFEHSSAGPGFSWDQLGWWPFGKDSDDKKQKTVPVKTKPQKA